jgi:hypothetical protein
MTKRSATMLIALFIWQGAIFHSIAGEQSLRSTLEKTWKAHLQASKSGKESEIQKTMSSFSLGTMKNNLAAAKRSLTPNIIRSIGEQSPDISKAEFVSLLEKGATAGLVYVRDSEETDASGKPRVTFIFIKFVKEASGWKVDAAMNIGSPKYQDDGKKSEFDQSDIPPTCKIDGNVRMAPNPVASPYASALLDISSYGYKTEVTVNDVSQGSCIEGSRSGLIEGGLRKGKNSITIVISQTQKNTSFHPRVKILRVLEDRKTNEVFEFEPKDDIEGKHVLTFTID